MDIWNMKVNEKLTQFETTASKVNSTNCVKIKSNKIKIKQFK